MKSPSFLYRATLSGLLILTATSFTSGCSKQEAESQQLKPQPYQTYTVKKQDMTFQVEFSATLRGINDVDIYPQVSGTIQEIRMEEGQEVHADDVLFVIDPVRYEAIYENAKASVASAEADLATAALDKSNKDKLYAAQKAVSYYEMQKSHNTYNAAVAALAEAEADAKKAKRDLDFTQVKSPVDGVCSMTSVRLGTLVDSSMSQPMVTVSDNSKIQAYFSISENLLLYIIKAANHGEIGDPEKMAQSVQLKMADGSIYDKTGEITAMSGVVDKTSGAITFRATFPNDEKILRAGSSGSVVISVTAKDGLVIPQTATYELQDKVFVYKVVDGKAKAAAITLMTANDGHHYVALSGIEEGDVIVANGVGLLREGTPIDPKPYEGDKDQPAQAKSAETKAEDKQGDGTAKAENGSANTPGSNDENNSSK